MRAITLLVQEAFRMTIAWLRISTWYQHCEDRARAASVVDKPCADAQGRAAAPATITLDAWLLPP